MSGVLTPPRMTRRWTEVRSALNRRKYISNLLRDVDKELNVHLSN